MAYADFTLSALAKQFDLKIDETSDLVSHVPEATLDEAFLTRLAEDAALALAVSTEKARSEFIIAPILSEMRRMAQCRIGLFSGVEFSVDPAAGLAGVCDFIVTRSPEQLFITAPVLMLVEAKNEDMKRGYAQCVAEMIAAQRFNEREGHASEVIHGAVTTGNVWRFLRLTGTRVNIDRREYYLERVAHIVGILLHLTAVKEPV
jgi:hypothetical protein